MCNVERLINGIKFIHFGMSWVIMKPDKNERNTFTFGSIYLYQTFTECLSDKYTYFDKMTWQMWVKVMERPMIL